ncbi:hypothetical protein [Myxococcus sp. CA040A]|uniref:hypothetical protein n=1 Tax=Myxococcus sp. CA040A TaxID=2741738 RepID=UPI00157A72FC|nr:hypothetical protein [Myxococcus sp. CA040A]NTX08289.1 hypothetical protein [Myxococcus sp. CA040A]
MSPLTWALVEMVLCRDYLHARRLRATFRAMRAGRERFGYATRAMVADRAHLGWWRSTWVRP